MAAHVPSRLYRSRSQKMLAGVCGGLGEYFDVDPVLIRLLFVVTTFISGAGILAYIVLWIVVPFEGGDTSRMDTFKRDVDDLTGRIRDFVDPPRSDAQTGGPAPRGEPDVTGYHGSYGPAGYGPGGAPSGATPFTTSKDASMTGDSTSARVPGAATTPPPASDAPGQTATADRPMSQPAGGEPVPAGSAGASGPRIGSTPSDSVAPADDTPLEIDPPAGPPSSPPHGPGSGSGLGAGTGAGMGAGTGTGAPFGPGTPPGGTPPGGTPPGGMPPFGAPFGQGPGTPPFGPPFGGPAGGPASGPFGGPAGGPGWGPAGGSSYSGGPSTGAPFVGAPPSERRRRRQHWAGALLILIGLMILGNNLGLLWWVKMQYLMPLLLVGAGAWLLFGRGRRG